MIYGRKLKNTGILSTIYWQLFYDNPVEVCTGISPAIFRDTCLEI